MIHKTLIVYNKAPKNLKFLKPNHILQCIKVALMLLDITPGIGFPFFSLYQAYAYQSSEKGQNIVKIGDVCQKF
jgi:hypothetical protein